jgi:hypothetical protein
VLFIDESEIFVLLNYESFLLLVTYQDYFSKYEEEVKLFESAWMRGI